MLSADEDITTELDHVVCRLMKLALKSSKGKQAPPPARWMQCKLLDLLTLTEKSISRRKRHFLESFPLRAIGFGPDESDESIRVRKLKKNDDTAALELLDKYKHLLQLSDVPYSNDLELVNFRDEEESTDFEFIETAFAPDPVYEYVENRGGKVYKPIMQVSADDSNLDRTQAWVEEDNNLGIVPYPDNKSAVISSSDDSTSFGVRYRYKKKPYKTYNNHTRASGPCKRSFSKIFDNRLHETKQDDKKGKNSKTNVSRKGRRRNAVDYGKRRAKEDTKLQPTASKPIPGSLMELCHPELSTNADGFNFAMRKSSKDRNVANEPTDNVAATKDSLLVNIIMDGMEETIALRRTIGIDADVDPTAFEQETVVESELNVERNYSLNNMHHIATENVHSQNFFLYDISEPSTSKGVRHLSTDVQCGPDTITAPVPRVSPANSVPRIPKKYSTGFEMRDSFNLVTTEHTSDFGTSTNNIENFGPTSPRLKFSNMFKSGIKIKDSIENVTAEKKSADCGCTTNNEYTFDKSLNVFTSSIKIGVSATDFIVRNSSGTCTDHDKTVITRAKAKGFTSDVRKNTSYYATSTGNDNRVTISSKVVFPRVNRNNKTRHSSGNITTKSSDFGTSTDERYRTISPVARRIEIKTKDSDTSGNIHKKVECATPTCVDEISDVQTYDSTTETKLLKPISSDIIEDSCSEFYGGCCSASSPGRCTSSIKNTSLLRHSKLSCGGVHIHSYKEKHSSEDVVYQGKWQRYKPKAHSRKKPYNFVSVKKVTDINVKKIKYSNSKHKISVKEPGIKSKVEIKPFRRPMPIKAKQEPVKKVVLPKSVVKGIRSNRNITKVASKIAMSSMLTKNTKCTRIVKNPTKVPLPEVKKDGDAQKKQTYKSYLPLYLKRRKPAPDKTNLNQSFDSVQISTKINKPNSRVILPETMSDPEETKCTLVKFSDQPQNNVSYVVFRNEIENPNRISTDSRATDSARKRNASRRSSSPASQDSSKCSTPDSIATVRAVPTRSRASTRRHSTSSNKSSLGNTESESNTPVRNRKFTKRGKSTKKSDDKNHDKENKPESSKIPFSNREPDKIEKTAFKGRNKNVYMAQLTNDGSPSKQNSQPPNKSSIRIPDVDSKDEIEKMKRTVTATISQKKPIIKSNNSDYVFLSRENKHNENTNPDNSNNSMPCDSHKEYTNNLLLTEHKEQANLQENTPPIVTPDKTSSDLTIIDNQLLSQWLESSSQFTIISTAENSIIEVMRHIVEGRLDFIEQSPQKYYDLSNSEELNQAIEELNKHSIEETLSLSSFKTAMTNENNLNGTLKSDLEDFDVTFDATLDDSLQSLIETTPPTTDLDLLSFKSLTSVSRYSELLLVDNEPTPEAPQTQAPSVVSSVREIFERKEQQIVQLNPPGTLAIQIFSGFSMNSAPVAGDQSDYVNLIDSETGSVAMEFARQVTSEEVFVSGRSSSYESCIVDEDADIVVPNWLFQIISQQQAVDQQEAEPLQQQQLLIPMPRPVLLPHEPFDVNGNVTEGLGVGAGAGDGRGMHSDHSQDSSGRGTSLSSSDTSSGQHSEAILIDPSAFTAQFDLMHDSISSIAVTTLVVPIGAPDNSFRVGEGVNHHETSTSRSAARHNPLLVTSDVDADVSSLDTDDVPDSSDN